MHNIIQQQNTERRHLNVGALFVIKNDSYSETDNRAMYINNKTMAGPDDKHVFTTPPSLLFIFVGIFIIVVMSVVEYNILHTIAIAQGIGWWIGQAFVALFGFGGPFMLLNVKTIVLTEQMLIIKRPLAFMSKNIPLASIETIKRAPHKFIIPDDHSFDNSNPLYTYEGKEITIKCHDGKLYKLDSFEIRHFQEFVKKLTMAYANCKN